MTERRRRRDVRPRVLAAVLADPHLNHREKVYLVTVLAVRAETVVGERRQGSRSMDERGVYALHSDYLAACMGVSADAVRRARVALIDAGWLSRVHPGTFGRPAAYQALVAGTRRAPLRGGVFCQPYEIADVPPLTPAAEVPQGSADVHPLASTEVQGQPDHEEDRDRAGDAAPEVDPVALAASPRPACREAADHPGPAARSSRQRSSPDPLAAASPAPSLTTTPATGPTPTTDRARDDGYRLPHRLLPPPPRPDPSPVLHP